MSDENERSGASAGSVAERPLGDPEIAVEILRLRVAELEEAVRRLADQDATLSVCDGAVTVTMDTALTEAEREALAEAATVADAACAESKRWVGVPRWANGNVDDSAWQAVADRNAARAATLRGLLERTKGGEQ